MRVCAAFCAAVCSQLSKERNSNFYTGGKLERLMCALKHTQRRRSRDRLGLDNEWTAGPLTDLRVLTYNAECKSEELIALITGRLL